MNVRVVKPGMKTTVQDLGRRGFQKLGVVVGGAIDVPSHRLANLLVGNDDHWATLELTLAGPTVTFEGDTLIALTGAPIAASVAGLPAPMQRPVLVRAGATLTCGLAARGCRTYLAIAGGLDVPLVLGSRSTYERGAFGGFEGRSLRAGDLLPIGQPTPVASAWIDHLLRSSPSAIVAPPWSTGPAQSVHALRVARIMEGPEWPWLTAASQSRFTDEPFTVSPRSDRMGYRLRGPLMEFTEPRELISEGVCPGTIQIPAGGEPIILMADCATTGGYAKVACVAAVDLPMLAQLRPGEQLQFQWIGIEEAQTEYRQEAIAFERLRQTISRAASELSH